MVKQLHAVDDAERDVPLGRPGARRPGAALPGRRPTTPPSMLVVTDLSGWRDDQELPRGDPPSPRLPSSAPTSSASSTSRLHSLSVSPDGTAPTSPTSAAACSSSTPATSPPRCPNPRIRHGHPRFSGRAYWDYEGAHSTVPIPGTSYLLTTEELYGKGGPLQAAFGPAFAGCPWGWVRIVDASNPASLGWSASTASPRTRRRPAPGSAHFRDNFSSYTSHNPTVLHNLALVTWHSAGLRAIDHQRPDPSHRGPATSCPPRGRPAQPHHRPRAGAGKQRGDRLELPDHRSRAHLLHRHPQRALHRALHGTLRCRGRPTPASWRATPTSATAARLAGTARGRSRRGGVGGWCECDRRGEPARQPPEPEPAPPARACSSSPLPRRRSAQGAAVPAS